MISEYFCAGLPCWQLQSPRLRLAQGKPQSTTSVIRSRLKTAVVDMGREGHALRMSPILVVLI